MKSELTAVLWLLLAAVGAAAQPSGNAPTPAAVGLPDYVVEPRRLSAAPSLDGRLDDPVWRQATLLTTFTQYELWGRNQYRLQPFSRQAVAAATRERLTLVPR